MFYRARPVAVRNVAAVQGEIEHLIQELRRERSELQRHQIGSHSREIRANVKKLLEPVDQPNEPRTTADPEIPTGLFKSIETLEDRIARSVSAYYAGDTKRAIEFAEEALTACRDMVGGRSSYKERPSHERLR